MRYFSSGRLRKVTFGLSWILLSFCMGTVEAQKRNSKENASKELSTKEFLKDILYTKEEVDAWLAGEAFPFAYYHDEFGWLLNDAHFKDGVDESFSVYTYAKDQGERTMLNYSDRPCRINTYGDSFTQCHQVSDHETWQEVLAGHLQEPVRNFGIGGFSVYQAYLRMLKEEQRSPAEYIIFNIYQDDHRRNLDAWRNIRVRKHPQFIEPTLPHLSVDLKKQKVTEHANPCPTKMSVYDLCDINKTYQLFKDDFALKIMLAHANSKTENPFSTYKEVMALTKTHGIETKIEDNANLSEVAEKLHIEASLFASQWIVNQITDFVKKGDKKLIFVLSYPPSSVARYLEVGTRWDSPFVDFLKAQEFEVIDLAEHHKRDFEQYKISFKDYLSQYYIGHYNPRGNFFCAYAIKDALVEALSPKPIPYQPLNDQ